LGKRDKLLIKILSGTQDNNIPFDETCNLLAHFGFENRIKGSHHIFYRDNVERILNLQPKDGKVKAYQVKQVRKAIIELKKGGFNG